MYAQISVVTQLKLALMNQLDGQHTQQKLEGVDQDRK